MREKIDAIDDRHAQISTAASKAAKGAPEYNHNAVGVQRRKLLGITQRIKQAERFGKGEETAVGMLLRIMNGRKA